MYQFLVSPPFQTSWLPEGVQPLLSRFGCVRLFRGKSRCRSCSSKPKKHGKVLFGQAPGAVDSWALGAAEPATPAPARPLLRRVESWSAAEVCASAAGLRGEALPPVARLGAKEAGKRGPKPKPGDEGARPKPRRVRTLCVPRVFLGGGKVPGMFLHFWPYYVLRSTSSIYLGSLRAAARTYYMYELVVRKKPMTQASASHSTRIPT